MSDDTPDPAWTEGYRLGYQKGFDAGLSVGFADAKLRAYLALDAFATASNMEKSHIVGKLREAFRTVIGDR